MRRLALLLIVSAAWLPVGAPDARASCAAAVVVDGRVLIGSQVPHPSRLPPTVGEHPAISPACNDGGPLEGDRETTVQRLEGVQPRVAVRGDRDTVYYDDASLTVIGTHPLHAALLGDARTPSYRQGRRCRPYRTTVRGRVIDDGVLRIRTAERTVFVSADAATRITNRPVYEPVREDQRLRITTLRCGPRRVADRVTFVGPAPTHRTDGPVARADAGWIEGWQVVLVLIVTCAAGLIALIWRYVGR